MLNIHDGTGSAAYLGHGVMLRVISLGAGVQSTTLALMAARGEIEAPDCAIFADTQWEPAAVYRHLDWLETQLPFPVHRVTAGDIRDSIAVGSYDPIPWYVPNGLGRRQCTKVYKLYPIRRQVRAMLGGKTPPGGCEMWVGISRDEAQRMKPSTVAYIVNRWPLIEREMTRYDCLRYLERCGVVVPKSACIGCPYHSDAHWMAMRQLDPPSWADAVATSYRLAETGQYMHRSLRPLDQAPLATWAERGQPDLFGNECEGMCGV
jgi:hypothetical protein